MSKNKVLIVVDMQKDFVDPDGLLTLYTKDKTEKLIKDMYDYIINFDGEIFCTHDTHAPDSCEFEAITPHCIKGTTGAELNDEIAKAIAAKESKDKLKVKSLSKSSFTGSEVIHTLCEYLDTEFYVVGVCTHICVHDIVSSLVNTYKEKWNKIPPITIPRHLVADFDPEMENFALKRLQRLYGVKVEELIMNLQN